jgi:hypothetical protein
MKHDDCLLSAISKKVALPKNSGGPERFTQENEVTGLSKAVEKPGRGQHNKRAQIQEAHDGVLRKTCHAPVAQNFKKSLPPRRQTGIGSLGV